MVNNIIADTTVSASMNQYDGTFSTADNGSVMGTVSDVNLLNRNRNGSISFVSLTDSAISFNAVRAQPDN